MGVGEPAADGHGVLRVEDVGCGRVVDYDCLAQVAADLGEVFDVIASISITIDLVCFLLSFLMGGREEGGM